MGETLTKRRRVGDEGLRVVKPCCGRRTPAQPIPGQFDGIPRGSSGKLRASSRGNTEGASVVRIYWA
jgi:hypothetical protein